MTEQEAYQKLGVSEGATKQEIKAAYNKAAFKNHPDYDKTEGATARMQEINAAKEIIDKLEEGVDLNAKKEPVQETRTNYQEPHANEGSEKKQEYAERTSEWNEPRKYRETPEPEKYSSPYGYPDRTRDRTIPHESFSDFLRSTRNTNDQFVSKVIGEFNKASRNNEAVIAYLKQLRDREHPIDQSVFIHALIRKAKELTEYYLISRRDSFSDNEYTNEVKKSFILVLAILKKVRTIDGLDKELSLVRWEISTEAGIDLWNELRKPEDLANRMLVIRAILNGKTTEEILDNFRETGREGLKEFSNSEVIIDLDEPFYSAA